MRKISLTQGKFAIVDDSDFEWLNQWRWHWNEEYAVRWVYPDKDKMVKIRMHRLIMDPAKDMEVDHINGDTLDNRRENLRVCTHAENCRNQKLRSTNTSGFKGVSWYKANKKWGASIRVGDSLMFLGLFETAKSAHDAYCKAAVEYHKEFGRTK